MVQSKKNCSGERLSQKAFGFDGEGWMLRRPEFLMWTTWNHPNCSKQKLPVKLAKWVVFLGYYRRVTSSYEFANNLRIAPRSFISFQIWKLKRVGILLNETRRFKFAKTKRKNTEEVCELMYIRSISSYRTRWLELVRECGNSQKEKNALKHPFRKKIQKMMIQSRSSGFLLSSLKFIRHWRIVNHWRPESESESWSRQLISNQWSDIS